MLAKGFCRCLVLDIAAVMVPLMLVQSVLTRLSDTTVVSPFCPCKLKLHEQPLGLFRPWHLSNPPETHFPSGNWLCGGCDTGLSLHSLCQRNTLPAADPEQGITEPELPPGEALPSLQTAGCSPTGRVPRTSVSQA